MTNEWRAVLVALANTDARSVYAEVVLALPQTAAVSSKKRDRAITTLTSAGLVRVASDGTLELVGDAMAPVLENSAEPKRVGIDRFVQDGRIERYPVRATERRQVLEWVAENAMRPGEILTEPEVNERLGPFDPDVAALRRYLVDEGLMLRTRSGTSYSRTPTPA